MNQELVKAQLHAIRHQIDVALMLMEMGNPGSQLEYPGLKTMCAHPSEHRTDLTMMGDTYRSFYCRACGITVQTNEAVGT